ncbi:MAG TPA: response regulator transcription factor [Saprospiraceae bacterium]|nr:response regulator transcription factor [Saprospiraceae bacterium]HNT19521.1 response regulator transcription factor [Saprospiraceae bacterium]
MKVVLIEDDEMLRKSLSFFLKSKGHEVVEFENGLDPIDYIRKNYADISIIVTDLNLPFAGGRQVIHATRQIKDADIQIIVLTSSGVESTELEVFELGADDFISKPFSPAVLLKRIEKLTST